MYIITEPHWEQDIGRLRKDGFSEVGTGMSLYLDVKKTITKQSIIFFLMKPFLMLLKHMIIENLYIW